MDEICLQQITSRFYSLLWNEFCNYQLTSSIYAEDPFIQAAAVLLNVDILITGSTSTCNAPFTRLSRDFSHDLPLGDNYIILGSIPRVHFRSLLPYNNCLQQSVHNPSFTNTNEKEIDLNFIDRNLFDECESLGLKFEYPLQDESKKDEKNIKSLNLGEIEKYTQENHFKV